MDVKTQSTTAPQMETAGSPKDKEESPLSFALFLAKLLIAVLIFRTVIFSPFTIPTESMLPRLWNGDYLFAAKWPYGFSNHSLPFGTSLADGRIFASQPEHGDVVIFKHPIDQTDYIKRVIALPGDTIALEDGQIILNGEAIARSAAEDFDIPLSVNTSCAWGGDEVTGGDQERLCRYQRLRETLPNGRSYDVLNFGNTPGDTLAERTIPEGHMFVMGDNRDNSRDSRFAARAGDAVGLVPLDNLVGEASFIIWSSDGSAEWIKPWTWFTAARWDRVGKAI